MTTPDLQPLGSKTDVGDLNLFDLLLMKAGKFELGIGPQLTAPTAGRDETGTGKWQAGLATLAVSPRHWGLIGGLVTWQTSVAGDSDRRTLGAGGGKVWKVSSAAWNLFLEPQWTVAHAGDGVPKFQIYAGLNLQFPL